jgi:hypothetical protein
MLTLPFIATLIFEHEYCIVFPMRINVMMKNKFICVFFLFLLMFTYRIAAAENHSDNSMSFSLVDKRELITQDISDELLLRIVKDRRGAGWDVSVVKKPFDKKSSNLLYHSPDWHGPYPSQIMAWQIAEKYFPNERKISTRDYPYDLIIVLTDPVIDGQSRESKFVSGNATVYWKRK